MSLIRFGLLYDLTVSEFRHPPSPTDTNLQVTKLVNIGNLLAQFATVIESAVLAFAIFRFIKRKPKTTANENEFKLCTNVMETMIDFLYASDNFKISQTTPDSKPFWEKCLGCICGTIIVIPAVFLHLGVSLAPPIVFVIYKNQTVTSYTQKAPEARSFVSFAFLDHITNFCVRTVMFIVVMIINHEWKRLRDCTTKSDIESKYNEIGTYVYELQRIFEGWFLIKVAIYFITIVVHSTLPLTLTLNRHHHFEDYRNIAGFAVCHLLYDIMAFLFIYRCGYIMNYYHEKCFYYSKVKEIDMKENSVYQFVPSLWGVNIPLDSPGYILSLFIAAFSVIANFIIL